MRRLFRFFRRRLHRRIFGWFGASILATGIGVSLVMNVASEHSPWKQEMDRMQRFAALRFAEIWHDDQARHHLAATISADLELTVRLHDERHRRFAHFGKSCRHKEVTVPIRKGEDPADVQGYVSFCATRPHAALGVRVLLALFVMGAVLWGASGMIARRLSKPLGVLGRVAEAIGRGELSSRAEVRVDDPDEVRGLAESINDMAARIERQINDQRALLAAVSHELRTPLSHMRLLVELAREADPAKLAAVLDDLESETITIDRLVGELLANARLDFSAMSTEALDAAEIAGRTLERLGADRSALEVETAQTTVCADPTLLACALGNLVDNAGRHGGGIVRLRVRAKPPMLIFEVEDAGPGIPPEEASRVFEPFYRGGGAREGSLGLGLALVKRIAEVHGGAAYAAPRDDGGAKVCLEIRADPP